MEIIRNYKKIQSAIYNFDYKKIQSAIYNFDYKKYQKIILIILSLMASSLIFYCVFKIYRAQGVSTLKTDEKLIQTVVNQLTEGDKLPEGSMQLKSEAKRPSIPTVVASPLKLNALNALEKQNRFEEFQETATKVEVVNQEESNKVEIQRISIKIYAETIQNLSVKSEEIDSVIPELMNFMLETIDEQNQLSIDLENEKVKFIELQIKANFAYQRSESKNSNKNAVEIAKNALTKTFLDNYVIELYGKLFALSQGMLIKNAKRDLEFLYQCLIEKEIASFGTRHGQKIENHMQSFHIKGETKKGYCKEKINPIIEQIIENHIKDKTEYNYEKIAIEINKFFNDVKEIELDREQKIQAIQYIKLNKLEHIFNYPDFQLKKQKVLITPDNSDEEIQDTIEKNDLSFVVVLTEEEKQKELSEQIKLKVNLLIDLIINYQEFIENLADYVNLKIDSINDKFKERLKTKISDKISFDKINNEEELNNFFKFNHIFPEEGITKVLLESFEEIKNELSNKNISKEKIIMILN